jgi:cystathionine beta-lyase
MTTFDFDPIIDRRKTDSDKWDKYKDRDIIPLWVADMDFLSPPCVIDALAKRVQHGVFGYSNPPQELVDVVVSHVQHDFGWTIQPDWIIWLPGLVCGLNVLCRTTPEVGDEIITFTPIYPPFLSAPPLSDRELVGLPLALKGDQWVMDFVALEKAITPKTKMILLCNPHNPTGRAWSQDELLELARIAQQHDLVIGSDDIHAGLILDVDKRHIPIASLSDEIAARTITLLAPSKTYNIAGLGCSIAIISDPILRRRFIAAKGRIVPHVNLLAYTAALAAYKDGEPWRLELIDYLRGNRDLVESEVANMSGLHITHVEATYLAWIDARGLGVENPYKFFEQAGVGLSDGADFDAPGFVRLNFGCSRTLLKEALARMKKACQR